ncbi:hypothetical protein [Streptomyces sp. NPDC059479]|uniref:hypothetical protein n=1 Tax=Streptomyces sp. NPDC059479 TaxID=3346848 RepID=UPI0036909E6C
MLVLPGVLPKTFDRKFHMYGPVGGHGGFLLRSGKKGYHEGTHLSYVPVVDILFRDVLVVAINDWYYPLVVDYGTSEELEALRSLLRFDSSLGERKLYALRGSSSVGYLIAGSVSWIDDPDGSTSEPSVLLGGLDRTSGIEVHFA